MPRTTLSLPDVTTMVVNTIAQAEPHGLVPEVLAMVILMLKRHPEMSIEAAFQHSILEWDV